MKISKYEHRIEEVTNYEMNFLRKGFEDFMRNEYTEPDLKFDDVYTIYHNLETELRFQGFLEGAWFMEYLKDNGIEDNE